jgi:hypothetical protein
MQLIRRYYLLMKVRFIGNRAGRTTKKQAAACLVKVNGGSELGAVQAFRALPQK